MEDKKIRYENDSSLYLYSVHMDSQRQLQQRRCFSLLLLLVSTAVVAFIAQGVFSWHLQKYSAILLINFAAKI